MKNSTPRRQLPKLQRNSQTSKKSQGNDGLKAVFYEHFSNELAPVLLGFHDSW